jgi:hypothetical protein
VTVPNIREYISSYTKKVIDDFSNTFVNNIVI